MRISLLPPDSLRPQHHRLSPNWLVGLGAAMLLCLCPGKSAEPEGSQSEERLKYEEPKSLKAAIYERGSERQKLLFRFKREATRTGSRLKVLRDFTYPDGKLAVREEAVYEGNNLVSFVLRELQIGALGKVTIRRSPGLNDIQFDYVKGPGNPVKTRREAFHENTLIGDMVGPFLAEHWEALMRGEKVKCRYIVVPRLETVGFTFLKAAGFDAKTPGTVTIKMEATSRIIAALVDPIYFSLEKTTPHRVVEYSGRTTPKLYDRGKWEDLDAVTVFDWK